MPGASRTAPSGPNGPTRFPFQSVKAVQQNFPLFAGASAGMADHAITVAQSSLDVLRRRLDRDRALVLRLATPGAPGACVDALPFVSLPEAFEDAFERVSGYVDVVVKHPPLRRNAQFAGRVPPGSEAA